MLIQRHTPEAVAVSIVSTFPGLLKEYAPGIRDYDRAFWNVHALVYIILQRHVRYA